MEDEEVDDLHEEIHGRRWSQFHDLTIVGLTSETALNRRCHVEHATDLLSPAPHKFRGDVLFCAVDIRTDDTTPQKVTEFGFALLDTRRLDMAPGMRGVNWMRIVKPEHKRNIDNWQKSSDRGPFAHPDLFAFGTTKYRNTTALRQTLTDRWSNWASDQAGPANKDLSDGLLRRKIILVAFDRMLVESKIKAMGLVWLEEAYELWDVQQFSAAKALGRFLGKPSVSLTELANALMLQNAICDQLNVLANAGNAAAFVLRTLIAGMLLTTSQLMEIDRRGAVCGPALSAIFVPDALLKNKEESVRRDQMHVSR